MVPVTLEDELRISMADGFTLTAVGDYIGTRVLSPLLASDPAFAAAVEVLRSGDAVFGNLETGIFDIRGFTGWQRQMEDWAVVGPPPVAEDLRNLGFQFMGRANNHAVDWSVEGMRETGRWLDEAGIVHAGVGETSSEARAPMFLQTPQGRVGLVSFHTTTQTDQALALDGFGLVPPRPGFNPLRLRLTVTVPDDLLERVREIQHLLDPAGQNVVATPGSRGFDLFGQRFEPGESTAASFEPYPEDVDALCRAVRAGKQVADLLVVSAHVHEEGKDPSTHPPFLADIAHALIDAGADIYIGHGVHRLWPAEIYAGRPIFYGLGNFVFPDIIEPVTEVLYDSARHLVDRSIATDAEVNWALSEGFDDPTYYESLVVSISTKSGAIDTVRLYPLELGHRERLTRRGVPHLATADLGESILARMAAMSEPLGTRVEIADAVGTISV
jgi:poly-gamma-glutamate synthesis protein (capsule biosynthesis protein)